MAKTMNPGPDLNYIEDQIEAQGLENAFCWNEKFSMVSDDEFHKLRNEFLLAYCALYNYLGYDTELIEIKFNLN
jgi:hypothetical protein